MADVTLKGMAYDLLVIGSGPGGHSAAIRAGQFGLKTALIEKDPYLGGTCLHVGCIPTKALLHTAEVWDYFRNPAAQGIACENPRLDYPKVLERKSKIVTSHARGIEFLMKKNKVEVIRGYGRLLGGGRVEVLSGNDSRTLEARNIILATGSEARMLPGLEPDQKTIVTNVEILARTEVPKSLIVIGAGAVGVEFASIFKRFGSDVTIFEMLPRLVPVEDEEISKELERQFKKQGIACETSAKVLKVERTAGGARIEVQLSSGKVQQYEAEMLLVAVGRKPNTENVGLDNTRAELDRGYVKVDAYQRTAEPGLYAIGDIVAGTPQLAHVATMEGLVAVGHIAGRNPRPVHKNRIPGATYTEPGIGSVGLTAEQARQQGYNVKVGKFPFAGNSKASILGSHGGFVKVVADARFGEILGVRTLTN